MCSRSRSVPAAWSSLSLVDDPRDDLTPEQILAAEAAAHEQALASLPRLGAAARAAFDAFEAEGFSAGQSLYLTGIVMSEPDFTAP